MMERRGDVKGEKDESWRGGGRRGKEEKREQNSPREDPRIILLQQLRFLLPQVRDEEVERDLLVQHSVPHQLRDDATRQKRDLRTLYPSPVKCNPSLRNGASPSSLSPAALQKAPQTSKTPTPVSSPTALTASA